MEYYKEIARGGILSLVGMLLGRLMAYLFNLVIARLGASNYGVISLGIAIVSFISLLALIGLKTGVTRYVAYYRDSGDDARVKGAITSALSIALPISILFSFLLFFFAEDISIGIFGSEELIFVLKVFAFIIPFASFISICVGVLRGFRRIGYSVLLKEYLQASLMFILALIFTIIGYGLKGATFAYALSVLITALISLYILKNKLIKLIKEKSINYQRELFLFSIPLILFAFLPLFLKWTDSFILGAFRDVSEVGVYTAASLTSHFMLIIPLSLTSLFMPLISGLYSTGNKEIVKKLSITTSKWIFYLNYPVFLILMIFSSEILGLFFGSEYITGNIVLGILSLGYVFYSLGHVHMEILSSLKKTKSIFYISLSVMLTNILLCYILIPPYGMIGGAVATLLTLFLFYIIGAILNYRMNNIQTLHIGILKSIIAGSLSVVITYSLKSLFASLIWNFVLIGAFLLIYFLLLLTIKGFSKEDNDLYMSFRRKIN